ncbi:MAG: MmcQ/YjbR family DNA-binding protein [Gammaproteobacteria bacterium]|nr:MmcQ/YjbR family DNA-binding protein [Gammaproteobacteria bacterium]
MSLDYDAIEALCAGLPGVTVDVKWGADRVYSVAGKMFLCLADQDRDSQGFSFKVPAERFLELTDRRGIRPAPYAARFHWIALEGPGVLPAEELRALILGSYALVAAKLPKRLRLELQAVAN